MSLIPDMAPERHHPEPIDYEPVPADRLPVGGRHSSYRPVPPEYPELPISESSRNRIRELTGQQTLWPHSRPLPPRSHDEPEPLSPLGVPYAELTHPLGIARSSKTYQEDKRVYDAARTPWDR